MKLRYFCGGVFVSYITDSKGKQSPTPAKLTRNFLFFQFSIGITISIDLLVRKSGNIHIPSTLGQNMRANKKSASWVTPKCVKSNEQREREERKKRESQC